MSERLTDDLHGALMPFLAAMSIVLLALIAHVIVLHAWRSWQHHRRQRDLSRIRPLVTDALFSADPGSALTGLGRLSRRHRPVVAALILEPLRVAEGAVIARASAAAAAAGLVHQWRRDLGDRRWWRRAAAARALGLIGQVDELPRLLAALDDRSEEVRAAAVDGLGRLRDPGAIPALVAGLDAGSGQQRVRVAYALRCVGPGAVPVLLDRARQHPGELAAIIELLGALEASAAIDPLIAWTAHDDPRVRAAALGALGAIGIDDRGYYHVLRALGDQDHEVRAMAAWSLGRSGRGEAAAYLSRLLDDEWMVGAQAARALRALGSRGRHELEAAVAQGSQLARQALWDRGGAAAAR